MGWKTRRKSEGFTLVELMIVVAIIGILAVLAIYGVTKYITNAKTGEARNSLGQIAKAAVAAYEEERHDATYIAPKSAGAGNQHQVCQTGPQEWVPSNLTDVSNKKYQSSQKAGEDWGAGDKNKGWPCLKFALTEPQYFRYGYTGSTSDNKWIAKAEGDLKGKGEATLGFSIGGKVDTTTSQMVVVPQIHEVEGPAVDPPGL